MSRSSSRSDRYLSLVRGKPGSPTTFARNLRSCVVYVDEIQKCPALLDEAHLLIEERGIRFLFTRSVKRKAIMTAKFYLFDPGIVRVLRRIPEVSPQSADFGEFFEHFIFHELKSWIDYTSPRARLSYWRSTSGYEVDFVIDDRVAIEVKAAERAQERDLRGLRALRQEGIFRRYILVCRESRPRLVDGIEILPFETFLDALWSGSVAGAG